MPPPTRKRQTPEVILFCAIYTMCFSFLSAPHPTDTDLLGRRSLTLTRQHWTQGPSVPLISNRARHLAEEGSSLDFSEPPAHALEVVVELPFLTAAPQACGTGFRNV